MFRPEIPKYSFVEAPDNFWGIRLDDTKYKGVIYRYGEIKFKGEDADGNGIMSFEYDILDPAGFRKEELVGEDIDHILGTILTEVIIESLKAKEANEHDIQDSSEESL